MILIDSYGWLEYFAEGPLASKYALYVEKSDESNTITPTIVVFEVYRRLKREKGEEKALEAYAQTSRTKVIELDAHRALGAADISLKAGLGMVDSIVYSTARNYAAELITSDQHMKGIEGVKFIEK